MNRPTPPRHPIVIIGAGMAGLSAAARLQELGIPHVVLERFTRAGGRLNSREGEDWIADHGTQVLYQSYTRVLELIRYTGMERNRVSPAGGVLGITAEGKIAQRPLGGVDTDRQCIDVGFGAFMNRLAAMVNVQFDRAVHRVRWDNDQKVFWWDKEGQVFWFEDENGEPIRDPLTRDVLKASGLILATTGTAALVISRQSRAFEGLVPHLTKVRYSSCYTALYQVPRAELPFYALEGEKDARLAWVGFEERKSPLRIAGKLSLLVVQAGQALTNELMGLDDKKAMAALYSEVRAVLPHLPERPISQTFKRWNVSRLESAPLGFPSSHGLANNRWPVNPEHAPFALAGDYLLGSTVEDAAQAGLSAVDQVLAQLPERRSVLGLELQR